MFLHKKQNQNDLIKKHFLTVFNKCVFHLFYSKKIIYFIQREFKKHNLKKLIFVHDFYKKSVNGETIIWTTTKFYKNPKISIKKSIKKYSKE